MACRVRPILMPIALHQFFSNTIGLGSMLGRMQALVRPAGTAKLIARHYLSTSVLTTRKPMLFVPGAAAPREAERKLAGPSSLLPRTTCCVQSPVIRARPSVGRSAKVAFQQSSTHSAPCVRNPTGLPAPLIGRASMDGPHQYAVVVPARVEISHSA